MKFNIGLKLLISHILVLGVGIVILAIVAQASLPRAYGRHLGQMEMMMLNPGMGFGHLQWSSTSSELFNNFKFSFYEAFAWAVLSGSIVAILISLFISRYLTAPVSRMIKASQRVADGHYNERVPVSGNDEFRVLAVSFNSMAEKLEHVETRRRQLIGDVAHELRTPLTTIKGSMEGLVDGILPSSNDTFRQVAVETERLNRLVNDLQELSLVESGDLKFNFQPLSIKGLVEEACNRLASASSLKHVTLSFSIPAKISLISADYDRLLQVLSNILNNALIYTQEGGFVEIKVEKLEGEVLFRIIDNGTGIPPEHLPYIFDRFYRVDKSRSRLTGGGSGIGLSIVKQLVDAHRGRIWAESAGEGKGCTVSFTIPFA